MFAEEGRNEFPASLREVSISELLTVLTIARSLGGNLARDGTAAQSAPNLRSNSSNTGPNWCDAAYVHAVVPLHSRLGSLLRDSRVGRGACAIRLDPCPRTRFLLLVRESWSPFRALLPEPQLLWRPLMFLDPGTAQTSSPGLAGR